MDLGWGIKGIEARGENEKTLSPFTRFRITKKSGGGGFVRKRARWDDREREREKHRELEM